jgi:eukaryotic-like serine/threonine-protein kinase
LASPGQRIIVEKLIGPEKLVLQAVRDLPKDQYGNVHDAEIASDTGLSLPQVIASLESLDQEGLISNTRLADGHLAAHITPKGKLAFGQDRQSGDGPTRHSTGPNPIKVVPKGLRSYDEHDADFFLQLLPGPRRSDGLPDSIHFWKVRIEETDPEKTFRVGLIYGPSGCGKSSLVKAGLIPRLNAHVETVHIEATSDDTERRLFDALRKRCPKMPTDSTLAESILALSEGQGLPPGKRKVLIVLDQFEQWLSTWRGDEEAGLVAALRDCNGEHVQAIVMVRDEFWMDVNRLEKQLGVEFRRTKNSYGMDLFDPIHARSVLEEFGRAFDRLPDELSDREAFLDQAVEGLSEKNKVAPVRLSLFAWMIRGRSWTSITLNTVGGAKGVVVNFLVETFEAHVG